MARGTRAARTEPPKLKCKDRRDLPILPTTFTWRCPLNLTPLLCLTCPTTNCLLIPASRKFGQSSLSLYHLLYIFDIMRTGIFLSVAFATTVFAHSQKPIVDANADWMTKHMAGMLLSAFFSSFKIMLTSFSCRGAPCTGLGRRLLLHPPRLQRRRLVASCRAYANIRSVRRVKQRHGR